MRTVDVLMITYDRADYARQSLSQLLASCDEDARVWIWHNGEDAATLEVARELSRHPRVAAFHHSERNQRLTAPTNWLWENATGDLLGKVDDDCLVTPGWLDVLRRAHTDVGDFGVVGSWRFLEEDFVPRLANRKIATFEGGHQLLRNPWVQGSGYLMKARCVQEHGLLTEGQSFTDYCLGLALRGYVNGWYYPFVREDHMDDPRSPRTGLRSDADLRRRLPLSAQQSGATTLAAWERQLRRSARTLQAVSPDPRAHRGWRHKLRGGVQRARARMTSTLSR